MLINNNTISNQDTTLYNITNFHKSITNNIINNIIPTINICHNI
jgi:hypothetical protein